MSYVSVEQCIGLILSHIGGIKLIGSINTFANYTKVARQLTGGGFSLPGMDMLTDGLGGMSIDGMLSGTFTNPLSDGISGLTSSIPTTISSLTSSLGSFSDVTGNFTGGMLSLSQVNSLTGALNGSSLSSVLNVETGLYNLVTSGGTTGLLGSLPNLSDITNKLSGVTMPDFTSVTDFGMDQMLSVSNGFGGIGEVAKNLSGSITSLTEFLPPNLNISMGALSKLTDDGNLTFDVNVLGSALEIPDIVNTNISDIIPDTLDISSIDVLDVKNSIMSVLPTEMFDSLGDQSQIMIERIGNVIPDPSTFVNVQDYRNAIGDSFSSIVGSDFVPGAEGIFTSNETGITNPTSVASDLLVSGITLDDHLNKLSDPLFHAPTVTGINDTIDNLVQDFTNVSGNPETLNSLVSAKVSEINDTTTTLTNTISSAKSTMVAFRNVSLATGQVDMIAATVGMGTSRTKAVAEMIVKPSPLAQMKDLYGV